MGGFTLKEEDVIIIGLQKVKCTYFILSTYTIRLILAVSIIHVRMCLQCIYVDVIQCTVSDSYIRCVLVYMQSTKYKQLH